MITRYTFITRLRNVTSRVPGYGQIATVDQCKVPLTTVYTFSSGPGDSQRVNIMDIESIAHSLKSHFLAKSLCQTCWSACMRSVYAFSYNHTPSVHIHPTVSLRPSRAWSDRDAMESVMFDYTPGSKSPVVMHATRFQRGGTLKLHVFGNITTEHAPKSLHAPCLFDLMSSPALKCSHTHTRLLLRGCRRCRGRHELALLHEPHRV